MRGARALRPKFPGLGEPDGPQGIGPAESVGVVGINAAAVDQLPGFVFVEGGQGDAQVRCGSREGGQAHNFLHISPAQARAAFDHESHLASNDGAGVARANTTVVVCADGGAIGLGGVAFVACTVG